jgi:UDP-N-acetylmuramoylalanine--D-glutamate ligase
MNQKLEIFKKDILDKKIAIIGLGVSNMQLAEYLGRLGVAITVLERNEPSELKDKIEALKEYNVDFSLGTNYLDRLKGFDVIIKTPGIRPDIPQLIEEKENGAVITSETEIFMQLCPCPIIGVTGSDGKTTTSIIIYSILKEAGYNCFLGGNIGISLFDKIDEIKPDDIIVLELSSFKLLTMKTSPNVSVITNISPDHLNMHASMEEYINAIKNIFAFQKEHDILVLNYDNLITRELINQAPGKCIYFSRNVELESGAFLKNNILYFREPGAGQHNIFEILNKKDILLPGEHNIENFLAAIAATRTFINADAVAAAAKTLTCIEHRIEFVRELNGVKYYNDSSGSTPTRTIATLNSFDQRVILIAGSYDKKLSYEALGKVLVEKVKHLILIGQTASLIEIAMMRNLTGKYRGENIRITRCNTLKQAVDCAYLSAKNGDIVLLSPASASFDMFKYFEERGNYFKKLVFDLDK